MGVSDDFSYIRTSQLLAETGHIHYVGWASAIIGWQLYLAAAFIKLFGFSFTAPRIGTLLIAVVTAYLLQRTLVRFGISQTNAVLGTLTFVLSPLFMPLSVTMMSDVPGFFSVLACTYGCVSALQALRNRDAILWLCFAVAINLVCGTSRQICWLGVLVIVPSALFLLRSRRTVLLYGLVANALGFGLVFAMLHWFNTQPYALPEPVALAPFHMWAWELVIRQYLKSALSISLLLFPLSLPFVATVRRFPARYLVLGLLIGSIVFYFVRKAGLIVRFLPFNGDWVGPHAMYETSLLASPPPVVLGHFVLTSLCLIAFVGISCIAATILVARPSPVSSNDARTLSWHQIGILFGPAMVVYFLLLSRHGVDQIFDRYLFTPIFVTLVCLLLYSQQHLRERWSAVAYVSLAAIAFYGVIVTHNIFALDRARVTLAKEIYATGIDPSHVDLGWESNGWQELLLSGYINEPHIIRPAGAFRSYSEPVRIGCHERAVFGFFPHLAPRYGLSYDPNVCDGLAQFAPVTYATWPFRQPTTLYVVKYPAPWQSAIDSANHVPPSFSR